MKKLIQKQYENAIEKIEKHLTATKKCKVYFINNYIIYRYKSLLHNDK